MANKRFKHQRTLVEKWAQNVATVVSTLQQKQGRRRKNAPDPIVINRIEMLCGPRAAVVDVYAGVDAGRLYKLLTADSNALARQTVPWNFSLIYAYMNGSAIRLECPWPENLMLTDYKLTDYPLPSGPQNSGRWFVGMSDTGAKLTMGLNENTSHFLIGGSTGSGKSYAARAAAYQLSTKVIKPLITGVDGKTHRSGSNGINANRLILLDGKQGQGLGPCRVLPNLVGPMATNRNIGDVIHALNWAVNEMMSRYDWLEANYEVEDEFSEDGESPEFLRIFKRLIIFIDEVQELIESSSEVLSPLRKLLAQGRAAHVHVLLSTQVPTADVFKDRTIKPNLTGRVALRTTHAEASRAILGQASPRADWLQGKGDAYVSAGTGMTQRVQVCYVPSALFRQLSQEGHQPLYESWSDALREQNTKETGFENFESNTKALQGIGEFDPALIAASIYAAEQGWGRQVFAQWCDDNGLDYPKGKERLRALINQGRSVHDFKREI